VVGGGVRAYHQGLQNTEWTRPRCLRSQDRATPQPRKSEHLRRPCTRRRLVEQRRNALSAGLQLPAVRAAACAAPRLDAAGVSFGASATALASAFAAAGAFSST
jgi:hypothetical protein